MVLKLAEKIAFCLFRRGYIEENEINIYKYGYSIVIDGIIDYTVLLILGILIGRLFMVCIFAVVFSGLRQFTGGYHADRRWKCISLSSFLCLVCVLGAFIIPVEIEKVYIPVISFISMAVIIKNAPVQSKAKKWNDVLVEKNRRKAVISSVILFVIICVSDIIFTRAAATAADSMFAVAVLIEYALWKEKRANE